MIHVDGLTKHYGGIAANSDINFTVNYGELRGIIGPNGAGKSTLLRLLPGIDPVDQGRVRVFGHDPFGAPVPEPDIF